jgi:hypothetical protein
MTQKRNNVAYLGVTPATDTWPILEVQGFEVYCRGRYYSVPALSRIGRGMTIEAVDADTKFVSGLPDVDLEMLKRHGEHGCLGLLCHLTEHALLFISLPVPKRRGIIRVPAMLLGYCNSISDYVRCAGPIERYLLWRGKPLVITDANGPVAGLG